MQVDGRRIEDRSSKCYRRRQIAVAVVHSVRIGIPLTNDCIESWEWPNINQWSTSGGAGADTFRSHATTETDQVARRISRKWQGCCGPLTSLS